MKISKTYISSLIPKGAIILDVGSYDGKDAAGLSKACKSVVHCFEPVSWQLIVDSKYYQSNNLIVWPIALGRFHGSVPINIPTAHSQSSSIKRPQQHLRVFPNVLYNDTKQINITTLDKWAMTTLKGKSIDFIWVDVNGAEADFIVGGTSTLSRTSYLYIEFCDTQLFDKSMNRTQLEQALPGFEVLSEYREGPDYGNLLMRNKNKK